LKGHFAAEKIEGKREKRGKRGGKDKKEKGGRKTRSITSEIIISGMVLLNVKCCF